MKNIKRKSLYPILLFTGIMVACNQPAEPKTITVVGNHADSVKPKYTQAMVDNRKDPSCGMPVSAGIEDTAHYGGKVYGFCSVECKNQFLKNPETLVKNADLK